MSIKLVPKRATICEVSDGVAVV